MSTRVPLVQAFEAMVEARALLFRCCEYEDSGEAVTPLLVYAHWHRLAEDYSTEFVLTVIRNAFRRYADVEL